MMKNLLNAFVTREIKEIFGPLCTKVVLPKGHTKSLIYIVTNDDRFRPEGKKSLGVAISLSGMELEESTDPLELFKVRAKNAAQCLSEGLKNVSS